MTDPVTVRKGPANRRGWIITGVTVALSVVLVLAITVPFSGRSQQAPAELPEVSAAGCRDLGIAGPAAWERMPVGDFRDMVDEQVTLGATRIRLSAVWKDIERERGRYDWSGLDQRVDAAVAAGLVPLMLIHMYPDWVEDFGVVGGGAAAEFGEFAEAVAARYGDRVDAYEIWNEPNLARFWPDPDPDAYAELLAESSPRITTADPGAEIISGGLAPATNMPGYSVAGLDFLGRLYELGAHDHLTAVAVHPYSYPERPSGNSRWNGFRQLRDYRELMSSHGDGAKRIWLTEYGAPTGGDGGVSERAQADMVVEALRITSSESWLGPIFLYTMYDLDLGADDRESYFGLLYGPGAPKPAFTAVREAAESCGA
ncbi:cellulase family glycosylhydrolase [Corynebacterium halotolerans]|uniref:Glycoside hydrolase family 5 domain-containing protein n=1 Tax=Corynebacterium halotolerans YIM 70093 = DSM 44683 TaxID=1121362 RepID=M1NVV3_9CORY|nr:cellulase family glycosylhydrolase [Corynebacterium halotolerans]AGF73602.1 hypothetical protein A605_13030 [Corynebacterium halotolerans YIM 70093 = DSM 44683]